MILDNDQDIQEKQEKILDIQPTLNSLEESLRSFYEHNKDNAAALFPYILKRRNEEQCRLMTIMVFINQFEETLDRLKGNDHRQST